jgi:predicted transposase YdaD
MLHIVDMPKEESKKMLSCSTLLLSLPSPVKTDILFYSLFELEPALLVHLAHLDIPETVQYKFQAIELKDIAKRTDAVLVPDTKDAPLIVAEVQFWKDDTMYDRLVSESARLRLQMPDYQHLQMVLVFPSPEIDPGAGVWEGLVERGTIRIVYLNEALEEQGNNNSPEERAALLLMNLTISPHDEATDRTTLPSYVRSVVATKNIALQRMFRDLFVSLYTSYNKKIPEKKNLKKTAHKRLSFNGSRFFIALSYL